jgi:hypothetical protein
MSYYFRLPCVFLFQQIFCLLKYGPYKIHGKKGFGFSFNLPDLGIRLP